MHHQFVVLLRNAMQSKPPLLFLEERGAIGLLRLAKSLTRRDEYISSAVGCLLYSYLLSPNKFQTNKKYVTIKQVLGSLEMIVFLGPDMDPIFSLNRQISYGLYELLKTGAANIHAEADWAIIFTLFEVFGAGVPSRKLPMRNGENSETVNGA